MFNKAYQHQEIITTSLSINSITQGRVSMKNIKEMVNTLLNKTCLSNIRKCKKFYPTRLIKNNSHNPISMKSNNETIERFYIFLKFHKIHSLILIGISYDI